ncbi:MAG: phosphatase PAP2 family protein [Clostridia bacterium]|nr:phosphatase PAP2 family protein [Clostridia bacterium]
MTLFTGISESSFSFDWEISLMEWVQAHMGAFGLYAASFFSLFGEELVCVAILGLIYWCLDKECGGRIGLTLFFAATLNPVLKNIFLRRRPYCDHSSIKCLRPVAPESDIYDLSAQGYSFPSGHSTNSVSLFTAVAINKKDRLLAAAGLLIPLLCGFSRICLGVHYPTDVICGWLLGLAAIFIVNGLEKRISNRLAYYALLLCMTVPGWLFCRSDDYYTSFGILAGFLLAVEFERRYVGFENTRRPLRCAFRLTGGILVFYGVRVLLRLPFSEEFLISGTAPAHAVRTVRYFVAVFAATGVYPMLFRPMDMTLDRLRDGMQGRR